MKITAIGCLHGYYPKLPGGDLLIVTGDLTSRDTQRQIDDFDIWLSAQKYRKKIFISGNHDNRLVNEKPRKYIQSFGDKEREKFEYLCDNGTEFEGLKIWGSPWTASFPGINPHCTAFTIDQGCDTDEWLAEKWSLIPEDTDILITHSPPYMCLDEVPFHPFRHKDDENRNVGSKSLMTRVMMEVQPRYHFFSHIHAGYGHDDYWKMFPLDKEPTRIDFYNCSIMNEDYEPVNKPWEIEI